MSVKASLKIVLKADDVVVAESENAELWEYVLSQLNDSGSTSGAAPKHSSAADEKQSKETSSLFSYSKQHDSTNKESAIQDFAKSLSLEKDVLVGACHPQLDPPFIHLDKYHWQELKDELPSRGSKAIPSIVIAASILVLWLDQIGEGNPTVDEAQSVLKTIDTRDRNPGRGLSNCQWLQIRNGEIVLNPAKTSMARDVARAYCLGQKPDFQDS